MTYCNSTSAEEPRIAPPSSTNIPPPNGKATFDRAEAARAIAILADPDYGFELMALPSGTHRTIKGCDVEGLVNAAEALAKGRSVYYRINPVPEDLLGAANNNDVVFRRWLYIDIDPHKPDPHKDDPATDAEHDAAHELGREIAELLQSWDWPCALFIDSGNGCDLKWSINLPNNEGSALLLRNFLAALAHQYHGPRGTVDRKVHNANRLSKLPGCLAVKGQESPERPYRPCRILHKPAEFSLVTAEMIADATRRLTPPPQGQARTSDDHRSAYGKAAMENEAVRVRLAPKGGRNNQLNKSAFALGQLVGGGVLHRTDVENVLREAAQASGLFEDSGCGSAGVIATIRSGIEAGMRKPRDIPDWYAATSNYPQAVNSNGFCANHNGRYQDRVEPVGTKNIEPPNSELPTDPVHLTDRGNAIRLARQYGDDLHFEHAWKKWLVWDGHRWAMDDVSKVKALAKTTIVRMYREAQQRVDEIGGRLEGMAE